MPERTFGGGEPLGPWGGEPSDWFTGAPGDGDPEASATQPLPPADATAGNYEGGGLDPEYLNPAPAGGEHLGRTMDVDGIISRET